MRLVRSIAAALGAVLLASSASAVSFFAAADGDVVAYFAGTGASYSETLGMEINGVETGITGLNNQSSSIGQTLVLGTARAGDLLTFFIDVITTGNRFYSDVTRNADGVEHIRFDSAYAGNGSSLPAGTYIGFEDLYGGGDFSYGDLTFVFTNVSETPVPEAATWAMMVIGFGMVGLGLRRRGASALA